MQWEPKQDSPAAIDDAAQHSAFMQRVAADLAMCQQPTPAPRPPAPRRVVTPNKQLGPLLEKIGKLVGQTIRESCERLERRIAELEAREWVGVFQTGKTYAKNSIVSHDGSCWVATRDCPEGKPGTGPACGWKLVVKRGRDGKDAAK